jgi:hypothetical protein
LDVIANKSPRGLEALDTKKVQMYYMTCYSLDEFKKFVFQSKFLDLFDIETAIVERIKTDEVELLKFGFRWLKFALFGENTLKIKGKVLETKRQALRSN